MIQKGSTLNVVDNSGVKNVCCIHVCGGYRKRYAFVGDSIVVSIKTFRIKKRSFSKVKKGDISKAIVVRTKYLKSLYSNESFTFFENSCILLNAQKKPLATRIFGSIPQFFRFTKYLRIISLSSGFTK
jgi:large subunit ribosomal protein L14